MRRALAATIFLTLVLTGCSGTDDDVPDTSPAPSATASDGHGENHDGSDHGDDHNNSDDSNTGIDIEIEDDRIEPSGKRVEVDAGEPISLEVESDRAGELHVHSSPEKTIAFESGKSVLTLVIDNPGIVDVEEHETGSIVL